MSKEYIYLTGKAHWVNNQQPDKFNKYGFKLFPNAESLEKIRELQADGLKNQLKKDPELGWSVNVSSPVTKEIKGRIVVFEKPKILDGKNKGPDGKFLPLPDNVRVGNGSDVVANVEVRVHPTPGGGKAKAWQWVSMRVDNLVPFETSRDFTDAENAQVGGLNEQPEQLF